MSSGRFASNSVEDDTADADVDGYEADMVSLLAQAGRAETQNKAFYYLYHIARRLFAETTLPSDDDILALLHNDAEDGSTGLSLFRTYVSLTQNDRGVSNISDTPRVDWRQSWSETRLQPKIPLRTTLCVDNARHLVRYITTKLPIANSRLAYALGETAALSRCALAAAAAAGDGENDGGDDADAQNTRQLIEDVKRETQQKREFLTRTVSADVQNHTRIVLLLGENDDLRQLTPIDYILRIASRYVPLPVSRGESAAAAAAGAATSKMVSTEEETDNTGLIDSVIQALAATVEVLLSSPLVSPVALSLARARRLESLDSWLDDTLRRTAETMGQGESPLLDAERYKLYTRVKITLRLLSCLQTRGDCTQSAYTDFVQTFLSASDARRALSVMRENGCRLVRPVMIVYDEENRECNVGYVSFREVAAFLNVSNTETGPELGPHIMGSSLCSSSWPFMARLFPLLKRWMWDEPRSVYVRRPEATTTTASYADVDVFWKAASERFKASFTQAFALSHFYRHDYACYRLCARLIDLEDDVANITAMTAVLRVPPVSLMHYTFVATACNILLHEHYAPAARDLFVFASGLTLPQLDRIDDLLHLNSDSGGGADDVSHDEIYETVKQYRTVTGQSDCANAARDDCRTHIHWGCRLLKAARTRLSRLVKLPNAVALTHVHIDPFVRYVKGEGENVRKKFGSSNPFLLDEAISRVRAPLLEILDSAKHHLLESSESAKATASDSPIASNVANNVQDIVLVHLLFLMRSSCNFSKLCTPILAGITETKLATLNFSDTSEKEQLYDLVLEANQYETTS